MTSSSNSSATAPTTPWSYSPNEVQSFPTYSITGELITVGTGNSVSNSTSSTTGGSVQYGGNSSSSTSNTTSSTTGGWQYKPGEVINYPTYAADGTLLSGGNTTSSSTEGGYYYNNSSSSNTTSSTTGGWQYKPGEVINYPTYAADGTLLSGGDTGSTGSTSSSTGFGTLIFPDPNYDFGNYNDSSNTGSTGSTGYTGSTGGYYYIDYTGSGYTGGTLTGVDENSGYNGTGTTYIDYTGSGYIGGTLTDVEQNSGYNGTGTTYIDYTGSGTVSGTTDYTGTNSTNGQIFIEYSGPTNILPNSFDNYLIIQPNNTDYTINNGSTSYTGSNYTLIPYTGSMENIIYNLEFSYNDGATAGITTSDSGLMYIYPQY